MKKLLTISLLAILLAGCAKESIETEQKGEFKVELLFEKNGCKVYRFVDAGEYIYWSDCSGRVGYNQRTTHHTGKSTYTTTKYIQSIND